MESLALVKDGRDGDFKGKGGRWEGLNHFFGCLTIYIGQSRLQTSSSRIGFLSLLIWLRFKYIVASALSSLGRTLFAWL